ncbi:hypothetical protein MKZ38_009119 [Zalerion maritima]|uniref:Thioesterase domain-containing protein n=1 Tax=Zalerion maritima TaxID=339359 RepID=A0AAD5RG63_9PEZI|nr:hypothetical protein MKZ38_009119 [Zalerion maritima]
MPAPPPSERPFFDSIPWCHTLLSKPNVVIFTPPSRLVKYSPSAKSTAQFFGRTLHTAQTIPHSIGFYTNVPCSSSSSPQSSPTLLATKSSSSPEASSSTSSSSSSPSPKTGEADTQSIHYIPSCSTLHALSPGLTGLPSVVHGGIIASLLDEAMGLLIELNQHLLGVSSCPAPESRQDPCPDGDDAGFLAQGLPSHVPPFARGGGGSKVGQNNTWEKDGTRGAGIWASDLFTANLDVKFRKPVLAPQVVLAEGKVERIEGRKMKMCAQIKDKDGNVLAGCTSLWVAVPRDQGKL